MDTPSPAYYRWQPNLPDGVYDTPLLGELIPGRIVEVPRGLVAQVSGDAAWEKASKKQYEAQPPIHEAVAKLRAPAADQEEN